jgi:hypothetical protein
MKRLLTYGLVILLISLCSFIAADVNEVVSAIKSGSVSQLSKYIDNTIEITFTDRSNTYSKSQAELVLKDFFNQNEVTGFEVVHKGDNPGVQFLTGTLDTRNGEYRTTIFMKQKGDKQLLQELRFEK